MTKISSIKKLQSIGRIQQLSIDANVNFCDELNMVYASNGSGKTTLSAVLSSLAQNDAARVTRGRKPHGIDAGSNAEVEIDTSSQSFKLENGAWNIGHDNLQVFDTDFVRRNVFIDGRGITKDNKEGLVTVALGSEIVTLCKQRDQAREKHGTSKTALDTAKKGLQAQLNANCKVYATNVDGFVALEQRDDLEARKGAVTQKLKSLGESEKLQTTKLEPLKLLEIDADFLAPFGKTLEDINQSAIEATNAHIEAYAPKSDSTEWLRKGMERAQETSHCPFCARDLSDVELFTEHFAGFFSEAYRGLASSIGKLLKDADDAQYFRSLASMVAMQKDNTEKAELWKTHAEHLKELPDIADVLTNSLPEAQRGFRDALAAAVKDKQSAMTEALPTDHPVYTALTELQKQVAELTAFNFAITELQTKIDAEKVSLPTTDDLPKLEEELAELEAIEFRFSGEIKEACEKYVEAKKAFEEAKKALETLEDKVVEKSVATGGLYKDNVNRVFRDVGFLREDGDGKEAGLALQEVTYQADKRLTNARTSIELTLNGHALEIDEEKQDDHAVCFSNTLSGGEKNVLGLSFFLAQFYADTPGTGVDRFKNLDGEVIVFDDPFTSLDEDRRVTLCMAISDLVRAGAQVFVLSHSKSFLATLLDKKKRLGSSLHLIQENETDHKLSPVEEDFVYSVPSPTLELERLEKELSKLENETDAAKLAERSISLLESFLRSLCYDSEFLAEIRHSSLGKILNKIEGWRRLRLPPVLDGVDIGTFAKIEEINKKLAGEKHGTYSRENFVMSFAEAKTTAQQVAALVKSVKV